MGDHIVAGGNSNQNVLHYDIQELFEHNHMVNVFASCHDLHTAPLTFMYGQEVINGLWATTGIKVTWCGYLAPGKLVPGNHSLLWMDVTYESTLQHQHLPILPQTFQARHLRLYDSKTVKRYLNKYRSLICQVGLPSRLGNFCQSISVGVPLTPAQAIEADAIDALRTAAMLTAECHCRKLKMGRVSFSPAMELPKCHLIFWSLAIK